MQDASLASLAVLEYCPCVSGVGEPYKGGAWRSRHGFSIEPLKGCTITLLSFVTRPLSEIEGWRQIGSRKRCLGHAHLIELPGTLKLASEPSLRRQASFWWRRGKTQAWALTFELSGRRRQDAKPGPVKMYRVPPDRAWWPAVGAPLERGVRPQCTHSLAGLFREWRQLLP